jgi:phage terminase large subunit-like protein
MRAGPKAAVDDSRLPFRSPKAGAERFAAFCRQYIVVPKGHGARRRLRLRPWQVELVASVLDATPRPRLAGWMLPRGAGKTSLVGAMALYDLLLGDEGASIVVAASDERQAGLCFGVAARMVELHDELAARVQVFQDKLVVPARGASFQVLPAVPKRLEGLDFSMAILDEFGRMDREVYEVVVGASGKRPTSIAIGIGTPPPDPAESVLTTIRDYVTDHPNDPSTVWREHSAAGFEDHPVTCRHCWTLANPSLGDFLAEDGLAACLPPRMRESSFRRARLCQLVDELEGEWLPPGSWAACTDATRSIPDHADVVIGADGSYSRDCTAIVAATVGEPRHVELVALWEPGDRRRVPIVEVEDAIRAAARRWQVREIVFDPFRWQRTMQVLADDGLPITEWPQTAPRMSPATQGFRDAVVNRQLTHSGDSRLARHVGNCVVREDSRGTRVAKQAKDSRRKIDAAVAAIMAVAAAATLEPAPTVEVYLL